MVIWSDFRMWQYVWGGRLSEMRTLLYITGSKVAGRRNKARDGRKRAKQKTAEFILLEKGIDFLVTVIIGLRVGL